MAQIEEEGVEHKRAESGRDIGEVQERGQGERKEGPLLEQGQHASDNAPEETQRKTGAQHQDKLPQRQERGGGGSRAGWGPPPSGASAGRVEGHQYAPGVYRGGTKEDSALAGDPQDKGQQGRKDGEHKVVKKERRQAYKGEVKVNNKRGKERRGRHHTPHDASKEQRKRGERRKEGGPRGARGKHQDTTTTGRNQQEIPRDKGAPRTSQRRPTNERGSKLRPLGNRGGQKCPRKDGAGDWKAAGGAP